MDLFTAQQMLDGADDLDELLQNLKIVFDECEYAKSLDICDLPTFGGVAPRDTMGIWSWDESRLLVGAGEFKIEERA
jgi:hypothetical protein